MGPLSSSVPDDPAVHDNTEHTAQQIHIQTGYGYEEPDMESILIRGRVCCAACGRLTFTTPCPDHQPREYAQFMKDPNQA